MIFNELIFKEEDFFYIDLGSYEGDFPLEVGDLIRFNHKNTEYVGKIELGKYSKDDIHTINILKS
jgi:hypothetical protein